MSQYPLRVPDYLMEEARSAAQQENVSLNQMLLTFIADGIGHRRAIRSLQERAVRGDPAKALEILKSLTHLPPEPDDEMPEEKSVKQ